MGSIKQFRKSSIIVGAILESLFPPKNAQSTKKSCFRVCVWMLSCDALVVIKLADGTPQMFSSGSVSRLQRGGGCICNIRQSGMCAPKASLIIYYKLGHWQVSFDDQIGKGTQPVVVGCRGGTHSHETELTMRYSREHKYSYDLGA